MSLVSWRGYKEALEQCEVVQGALAGLQGVGHVALASLEGVIYIFTLAHWESIGASAARHWDCGYNVLFSSEGEEDEREAYYSALLEISLTMFATVDEM